jgi:hypothetical protein
MNLATIFKFLAGILLLPRLFVTVTELMQVVGFATDYNVICVDSTWPVVYRLQRHLVTGGSANLITEYQPALACVYRN